MLVRLTLPGTTWRWPTIDMAFAEAVAGDGTTDAPNARTSVLTRIPRRRCIGASLARPGFTASPRLVGMTEVAPVTDALVGAIRNRLPELRLLTDAVDRESYRRDETAYLRTGLPCAVALPTETRQVAELVRLCGEFGVPIVPRGAGTGLSGGAAGIEGALTIAFTAMDKVLEIDADNLVVVTQPGIINAALKKAVAAEGLSTRPIRRASRSARSAGTSERTRAACAASSTARRASRCSGSRS